MLLLFRLTSIVQVLKRGGLPNEIGHSRGGASTKIHAVVDAYGYPVYFMISEGQRNDINYAIPLLNHIRIDGSKVLADRGYDSNQLMYYIYDHGGEESRPFHPVEELNLTVVATGGFTRKDIWAKIIF